MTDEAKKARAAYQREWARKNPDKVRAYSAKHWQKMADKLQQEQEPEEKPEAVKNEQ